MSSDWPQVWLLFATYKRTVAALGTIASLEEYLKYPNIHYHICDDGSGETDDDTGRDHVDVLKSAISEFSPDVTAHIMNTPPGQFNTGGNINVGIRFAQKNGSLIYMLVFDDWALLRGLDIRPHVDILDNRNDVGFIRLSYWVPGMSGVCVNYPAPRMNNAHHMWVRLVRKWTLFNPWATDTYMISTQPFLAHMRFHEAYGMHPENVNAGEAEIGLGKQYNESPLGENGPQVLYPIGPGVTHAPWGHMVGRAHHYKAQFGA